MYEILDSESVITPGEWELFEQQTDALAKIRKLVDVSDGFRATVLFLAQRMTANRHTRLFFFMLSQLSELGTGMDSSFENGGTQSDRRDDVILHFITDMGGSYLTLRLRGSEASIADRNRKLSLTIEPISDGNRSDLADLIDRVMVWWWSGEEFQGEGKR